LAGRRGPLGIVKPGAVIIVPFEHTCNHAVGQVGGLKLERTRKSNDDSQQLGESFVDDGSAGTLVRAVRPVREPRRAATSSAA
jgi:hypothetical protein